MADEAINVDADVAVADGESSPMDSAWCKQPNAARRKQPDEGNQRNVFLPKKFS